MVMVSPQNIGKTQTKIILNAHRQVMVIEMHRINPLMIGFYVTLCQTTKSFVSSYEDIYSCSAQM